MEAFFTFFMFLYFFFCSIYTVSMIFLTVTLNKLSYKPIEGFQFSANYFAQ